MIMRADEKEEVDERGLERPGGLAHSCSCWISSLGCTAVPRRLKVLLSAYACEPGKGSEPEVGWQWALQMARFHDVTVLTRANNRPAIESALDLLRARQPLPNFVYHDRGASLLRMKQRWKALKLYYLLWQRSAWEVVARLHEAHRFDLMHHVTFAAFRYPVAIWGHGVPCIWGPIGGIESIPRSLLPWRHPRSLVHEIARNIHNFLQTTPFHVLPSRARATTRILVSTFEMQRTFSKMGIASELTPTIGLRTAELPFRPHQQRSGPLKLLYVGNIITLKGIDLALEALRVSQTQATLDLVGDGNYLSAAQRLVKKLGLEQRTSFLGRLPREQVLALYGKYDAFIFPSLHDTGGYAVIEAMFNQLPVICLDCGGPAVALAGGGGIKVPLNSRGQVISGLAEAIRCYDTDRQRLEVDGETARKVVLNNYDWDRKGEKMNQRYQEVAEQPPSNSGAVSRKGRHGMGGLTNIVHQVFSLRGIMTGILGLFLIGSTGFLSIGLLKRQAKAIVSDTLPGLAYAGEANTSLAQAFNQTLLLLTVETPKQQELIRKEIESFSQTTTSYLQRYKADIYEPADRANFDLLQARRQQYLRIRHQALEMASSGKRQEAIVFCKHTLLPAYTAYRKAADRLFEYNIRQGEQRGHTIMTVCTVTQFAVAGFVVIIFVIGFLIGLFW